MTAAETFAAEAALIASAALARRRTREEIFSIGRVPFRLVASDERPDAWLGRAFLGGSENSDRTAIPALHRLMVWDGIGPEALPPQAPWRPNDYEPLGVVQSYSNEAVRCAVDIHTDSLIIFDHARNSSLTWFPSIVDLPAWAKASPFRIILSWLCNRHRMQIVHGAAVAIDGRAVLLAGAGGSGKSTTALACALAGLGYLGDDYCAIEPAAGKVHMVYRTAKLFRPTLELLPALDGWIDNRDRLDAEKGVLFLGSDHMTLVRSAELSAIVLPRVGTETSAKLYPATREEAVKAILPSTIGGLMGGTSVTPRLIMELVRSVPAFHLVLGRNLASAIDSVTSLLVSSKCPSFSSL